MSAWKFPHNQLRAACPTSFGNTETVVSNRRPQCPVQSMYTRSTSRPIICAALVCLLAGASVLVFGDVTPIGAWSQPSEGCCSTSGGVHLPSSLPSVAPWSLACLTTWAVIVAFREPRASTTSMATGRTKHCLPWLLAATEALQSLPTSHAVPHVVENITREELRSTEQRKHAQLEHAQLISSHTTLTTSDSGAHICMHTRTHVRSSTLTRSRAQ